MRRTKGSPSCASIIGRGIAFSNYITVLTLQCIVFLAAIDKAVLYVEKKELPTNWDLKELLAKGGEDDSTSDSSDEVKYPCF